MVSDIPAGDGKVDNPFLQCTAWFIVYRTHVNNFIYYYVYAGPKGRLMLIFIGILYVRLNCTNTAMLLLVFGVEELLLLKTNGTFLGDVVTALGPAAISVRPVPNCRRSFRQTHDLSQTYETCYISS